MITKTKLLRSTLAVALLATGMFACKKDVLEPKGASVPVRQDTLITFEGLPVKHTYDNPAVILNYKEADYKQLFVKNVNESLSSSKRIMSAEQATYPTLEELANIEKQNAANYPNFANLDSADIVKIKANFPTLTEKQIADNIGIIEKYYTKNLQYDVLMDAIDLSAEKTANAKSGFSTKTTLSLSDQFSWAEFWYLLWRPGGFNCVYNAKRKTEEYMNLYGYYGPGSAPAGHLDKWDAYRHCLWSTLMSKYYAQITGDKVTGYTFAHEFGNLHESEHSPMYGEPEKQMDLHNNQTGRVIFNNTSRVDVSRRWWWFTQRTLVCSSDDEYRDIAKAKMNVAIQVPFDDKNTANYYISVNAISSSSVEELVKLW